MNDEFVKLVKKSMLNKSLYAGLESASILIDGDIFLGYILKFNKGDLYLFISNKKNGRLFHSGRSIFGDYTFKNRCIWIDESDLIHVCEGMLV